MTGFYWHSGYNYNQLRQLIISDCLKLASFLTGLRVSSLALWRMTNEDPLTLRLTVSRPVCLGIYHIWGLRPDLDYCRLRACWCGALSLTRGRADSRLPFSSPPLTRRLFDPVSTRNVEESLPNEFSFINFGESKRGHHLEQSVIIFPLSWECLRHYSLPRKRVNPWQRFDLHQRIRCSENAC
jgi:hypothetical protein